MLMLMTMQIVIVKIHNDVGALEHDADDGDDEYYGSDDIGD